MFKKTTDYGIGVGILKALRLSPNLWEITGIIVDQGDLTTFTDDSEMTMKMSELGSLSLGSMIIFVSMKHGLRL